MMIKRLLGVLGVTEATSPFCILEKADWNSAVVHHEVGHAVVWNLLGFRPMHIRFVPYEGVLAGATGIDPWDKKRAPVQANVERLMAGEAAARRYLGLPSGRLSLRNLESERMPLGTTAVELAENAERYLGTDQNQLFEKLEDGGEVLRLVRSRRGWKPWVAERLIATERMLDRHWRTVELVADRVDKRLRQGVPCLQGEELWSLLDGVIWPGP
ncbi:MAG: hypothetical protein CO108_16110 [Deltaproteobacteria bacterium CG_4_9_14_3_um_filter_63_12]|nr:MAG: hypothetical protein CO108_16110 [Deltaproteobacteria bacterium CG_4_9_14_3_um_filter_63_12]